MPVYPTLQAQVNDPKVLVHVEEPLPAQLFVPNVHSFKSEKFQITKERKRRRKMKREKGKKEPSSAAEKEKKEQK